MLYLTCSMKPSVDLAPYGVSLAKDLGILGLCTRANERLLTESIKPLTEKSKTSLQFYYDTS